MQLAVSTFEQVDITSADSSTPVAYKMWTPIRHRVQLNYVYDTTVNLLYGCESLSSTVRTGVSGFLS